MNDMKEFKGKAELDRFLETLRADKKSAMTIRLCESAIRDMLKHINKQSSDITSGDLERYKEMRFKKLKKTSIIVYLSVITMFFKYLGLKKVVEGLTKPKLPKRLPVYLTEDETTALLNVTKENIRDYAILITFLYEGLRVSELRNLRISDIQFKEDVLLVHAGKGDKDRQIPLHPEVKDAIMKYLRYRYDNNIVGKDKDALFLGDRGGQITWDAIWYMIKRYAVKAGINKRLSAHKLRHTALSHWYKATGDIRFVQKIAGHARLSTTEIYVHTNVDYLKEVMKKANFSYKQPQPQIQVYKPLIDKKESIRNKHTLDYFG